LLYMLCAFKDQPAMKKTASPLSSNHIAQRKRIV